MTEVQALQRWKVLRDRLHGLTGPMSPFDDPYAREIACKDLRKQLAAAEAVWQGKRQDAKIARYIAAKQPFALVEGNREVARAEPAGGRQWKITTFSERRKSLAELRDSRRGNDWLEYCRSIARRP